MVKKIQISIELEEDIKVSLPQFVYDLQTLFLDEHYPGSDIISNIIVQGKAIQKTTS